MRIGLSANSRSVEEIVEQGRQSESDGFTSLWFGSLILGDPLAGMTVMGRETSTLELGTSVLQTYPCHPILQANRIASVANAIGRSVTLGIGPSNEYVVRTVYGRSYDHPGRNAEEYVRIVTTLLRNEAVDIDGEEWSAHGGLNVPVEHPVQVLLSAMAPRMLRAAGQHADGTITFLAGARALESLVVPHLTAAAEGAGRPSPRVVAGIQVAVHDDESEVRSQIDTTLGQIFDNLAPYKRILAAGGFASTADAAVTGDETSVVRQLQGLIDAGATDLWVSPIAVGEEPEGSLRRTLDVLRTLVD